MPDQYNPEDLHEIKELVTSENWKHFRKLLSRHVEYLNQQALNLLDSKKLELAIENRIRASECQKILGLVEGRLSELKQEDE